MEVGNYQPPRKSIRSFPLGDELLLFDADSGRIFRINDTAGVIWRGCRAGLSIEAIINGLWSATGTRIGRIAKDVYHTLAQWQAAGLLQVDSLPDGIERQHVLPEADRQNRIPQEGSGLCYEDKATEFRFFFKILDTCFCFRCPTREEFDRIIPIFKHLATPAGVACDTQLSIARIRKGYALLQDGVLRDWCKELFGIAPMVQGNSLLIAYELSHCLFGLHAAAVVYNNQSILMPAASGYGKSTLTAALVGSGFHYCADDLVLLTSEPICMRPVPVAIGLKQGSWDPLGIYHPQVAALQTHVRIDGRHIRYLVPPMQIPQLARASSLPVDYILFPRYCADIRESTLTRIKPADGLQRLCAAGYDLHGALTADIVGRMVAWISGIACYDFRINDLDKAVKVLQDVLCAEKQTPGTKKNDE